nr:glycosyltransferase [Pseudomonadota bacterium]
MSLPGWLGGLSLLVWLVLVLGRAWFWRPGPWLPPAVAREGRWPAVAVVIPARNEAALLPRTLPGVLGQDYPGELRIFLVDDHSDDGTADTARNLDRHGRLSVLAAPPLPPGWTGKLWALQQGVERSDAAFLLFTDADIAHPPDLLRRLVARALADDLDLVSVMARL